MGFTKALYYPTIDIHNWDWSKSAALFWDNIQTIVPESIVEPYQERVSKVLFDHGILTPYHVNPDMDIIKGIEPDVWNFLDTNEGFDYLVKQGNNSVSIHQEKLPREIRDIARIHPEKFPNEIRTLLENDFQSGSWLEVNSQFAKFYMSLLANKICEHSKLVLLTDDSQASRVTEKAKLDNQRKIFKGNFEGSQTSQEYAGPPLDLAQGILSNLAFKGIRFSPDTKIEKILEFKRKHQDELGLYRNNIENLVSNIPDNVSFEALQQHVEDIYINEFKPSYNNFQKALKGFKLKWINDHVMKVAFFKGGTATLVPFLLGASIPQALLAGAGISITTSIISYNVSKKQTLRESPYSYLVSCENELNKDDLRKALRNTIF